MENYIGKIIACVVTLALCVVLPIGLAVVFAGRHREERLGKAWLIGAAGFLVPQVLVRMPILTGLSAIPSFESWAGSHLLLYTVVMALTAAFAELVGRCAGAGLLRREMTFRQALAAGMGHGGIESILLIGVTYANNLAYLIMLQTGKFDAMVAEAAANGVDTAELTAAALALQAPSAWLFLLAALERVLTMMCQAGMTVMVFYGFYQRKPLRWMAACLGIHFLLDCLTGVNLVVRQQWLAYAIIYAVLAAMAVLCMTVLRKLLIKWKEETAEPPEASETERLGE